MKHKLTVVICLVVIVALSALSVKAWHTERVQQKVHAAKVAANAAYKRQVQHDTIQANQDKVKAECQRLQAFYDVQKTKLGPRPECNLQQVQ